MTKPTGQVYVSRDLKAFHRSGSSSFWSSQFILPASVPFTKGGMAFASQNIAAKKEMIYSVVIQRLTNARHGRVKVDHPRPVKTSCPMCNFVAAVENPPQGAGVVDKRPIRHNLVNFIEVIIFALSKKL